MDQVAAGTRRRNLPAPPRVIWAALTDPHRDPDRPWLTLLADETAPTVLSSRAPDLVVWSSLWPRRPDATVRFELPADAAGQGCDLRWTLLLDEPLPDGSLLGHLRKRLNQLIHADLRYTLGQ